MRALTTILALASLMLPRSHRARWREEALAVLVAVHGSRRWWFLADTVVKVPLLAWEYRRPAPGSLRSKLAGALLVGMSTLGVAAVPLAPVVGEATAEFLFLLTPCGMVGVVALHSFRRGGVLRPLVVTLFAGTWPITGGLLSVAADLPLIAVVSAAVPGAWLATVSAVALARRSGPAPLAVLGLASGAGLFGVLTGVQLVTHVAAVRGPASLLTALSLVLLVPAYLGWSWWTGIRLLRREAA